jgi:hypothetical protein
MTSAKGFRLWESGSILTHMSDRILPAFYPGGSTLLKHFNAISVEILLVLYYLKICSYFQTGIMDWLPEALSATPLLL